MERDQLLKIVTLTEQPHLAPAVAEWLLDEFRHALSPSYDQQVAKLLAQKAPEETFVLFDDDVPVGTASLVASDLPSRPDLTPWLASVLVRPQFRGRGYSAPLVKHVEGQLPRRRQFCGCILGLQSRSMPASGGNVLGLGAILTGTSRSC